MRQQYALSLVQKTNQGSLIQIFFIHLPHINQQLPKQLIQKLFNEKHKQFNNIEFQIAIPLSTFQTSNNIPISKNKPIATSITR